MRPPKSEKLYLWRIYLFDQRMNIVDTEDRLLPYKPHSYAQGLVKKNKYYTYAIGPLS